MNLKGDSSGRRSYLAQNIFMSITLQDFEYNYVIIIHLVYSGVIYVHKSREQAVRFMKGFVTGILKLEVIDVHKSKEQAVRFMKGFKPASFSFGVIDVNKYQEQAVLFIKGRQAGIFFLNASIKKTVPIFRDCRSIKNQAFTLTV